MRAVAFPVVTTTAVPVPDMYVLWLRVLPAHAQWLMQWVAAGPLPKCVRLKENPDIAIRSARRAQQGHALAFSQRLLVWVDIPAATLALFFMSGTLSRSWHAAGHHRVALDTNMPLAGVRLHISPHIVRMC